MGGDGARGKDWLRARGHHLCLTDTFFGWRGGGQENMAMYLTREHWKIIHYFYGTKPMLGNV